MKTLLLVKSIVLRTYFFASAIYLIGYFMYPMIANGRYILSFFSFLLFPLTYFVGPFLMGGYNVLILVSSLVSLLLSIIIRSWVKSHYGNTDLVSN